MPPKVASSSDVILTFLKSDEFQEIIRDIVVSETQKLSEIIGSLRTEVENLKESNLELVKLFDNANVPLNSSQNQVKNKVNSALDRTPVVVKTARKATEEKGIRGAIKTDKSVKSLKENKPEIHKRKYKNSNIIQGEGEDNMSIKGVSKLEHFHIYRLDVNLDETDILKHLKDKNIDKAKCVKLNSKYPEEYSSFKVSVMTEDVEILLNPKTWPKYTCINRFLARLERSTLLR